MIIGQGNAFIQPNSATPPTPPVPPFPLNALDNGLSVDPVSFFGVLGQDPGAAGDPAQLLSNREIPLAGFDFSFGSVGNRRLFLDLFTNAYRFGDIDAAINGNAIVVDDANNTFAFNQNGVPFFDVFPALGWDLGDYNNVFGGIWIYGNNSQQQVEVIGNVSGGSFLNIKAGAGNKLFEFGDTLDVFNGNRILINDTIQEWAIGQRTAITNTLLNFPSAGIGLSFFDSNGTNPFLLPDPGTGGIAFMSAPDFSTQLALADAGSGSLAQLGDLGVLSTGMLLHVDVPNSLVTIQDTAMNAAVQINGVNGFTGTVAPPLTITVDGGIVTNVA